MKHILTILILLLSAVAYGQDGANWNKYFIKGSLAVGKLKYNKADSATYAKNCAWLEIGGDTTTRGMIIPRVLDVAGISTPVKGLIAYDLGENAIMYYDGSAWSAIGAGGGSIGNAGYGLGKTGSTFYVDTTNIVNINYLEAQNFATEEYVDSIVNSHHHVVYAEHYTDQYGYTDSAIWAALNDAGNYGTVDGGWLSYTMMNGIILKKGQKLRNAKLKRADETTALLTSQYDVGETFVVVDAIPAGWAVGNTIHAYTGDAGSLTNVVRTITAISNDTVYMNGLFGINFPVGATVRKVFNLVTYTGFFDTTADNKLTPIYATLDNVTFDGNRANNSGNFSWTVNSTIWGGLMEIYNCNFYDIPNENISGQAFKIFGGEAINLNGSFHHSSASLFLYELMGFSTIITNTRIINTNLEAIKNEHGDAAIEHSYSAVNVIITGNYFRNVKFVIDNFQAGSTDDSTFLPPYNITFTGNIVDTCWGGGFMTSPEFILDGSTVLRKGGSATFTGNTIISAGTGLANDYRDFKPLIDTAFNQITFTGNALVNTEFIWPQSPNIHSDINGEILTRTADDNSIVIGNKSIPHIQIDNGRMAIGSRLHRTSLFTNGGTLEVDNDMTIRAGGTTASSSARLRLCRYGPVDTPILTIQARMDSITYVNHMKRIEFYNPANGLNRFTIFHDAIGNNNAQSWYLRAGRLGNDYNVAEIGNFGDEDGYIKLPANATYWSAQSPQLQVDYLAVTGTAASGSQPGFLVFGYNNTLRAYIRTNASGALWQLVSATGKSLMGLDANDRVGFGLTTMANTWDFAGNVAADSIRLKGDIAPGSSSDSIIVKGTSDKFLKSLRPANHFLLKEDSSLYTTPYDHDTLAANIYVALPGDGAADGATKGVVAFTAKYHSASGGVITPNNAVNTLTDGATITWNTNNGLKATVTLGGNRTLSITNAAAGDIGVLIVKQDGTGGRTLTLPGSSKVINGGTGAITLSTAANAIDILSWFYDGTNYYWNYGKNYN